MKKTMIKSAIAAASATALSSGALAWDTLSEFPGQSSSGTAYYESHSFARVPLSISDGWPCTLVCVPGSFNQATSLFINKSTGGTSGEDMYIDDECNDYDQRVLDADASGNPILDASGNMTYTQRGFVGGLVDSLSSTVSYAAGDFPNPGFNIETANSGIVGLLDCEVVVSASGKLKTFRVSAAAAVVPPGETEATNYYFFSNIDTSLPIDQQVEVFFEAGNGEDPYPLDDLTELFDGTVDVTNPAEVEAWGQAAPRNWVQLLGGSNIAYLTCDARDISSGKCNAVAKSVPVPALAAAMLGLGLVGITYVTGRRRSIK